MGPVYVDTSVLLRVLLPGRSRAAVLEQWASIDWPVCSDIIEIEAPRAIDRLRVLGQLSAEEAAERLGEFQKALAAFDLVEMTRAVRLKAVEPYPWPLRTLDGIHFASAQIWRAGRSPDEPALMATHDPELGGAARAAGWTVLGWR